MSLKSSPVRRPTATRSSTPRAGAVQRSHHSLLVLVVAALALVASVAGLVWQGVYGADRATAEMFRGFDVVTAVVAVALAVAFTRAVRGSWRAELLMVAMVAYVVYTYAYYAFGTGFNDLFLLHTTVLALGMVALVLTVVRVDVEALAASAGELAHPRWVGGILGLLAVALGGMWGFYAVHNAVTGEVPPGSQLVESDTIVHLGMAVDLSLLVPLYVAAAVLVWRRRPWCLVLAGVALFAGLLHQVSYVVALPFQAAADVPGAVTYDPVEPVIILLYLVGSILLLRGARKS